MAHMSTTIPSSRVVRYLQRNFEPYDINPFNLFFKNPNREYKYRDTNLRVTIAYMRISLCAAIVLIAAYGILDPFIFGTRTLLRYVFLVRFAILLPPPIFFLCISFHRNYYRYAQIFGTTGICVAGIGFFLIAIKSDAQILVYTFPAVVMVTLFSFFFSSLFFLYAFLAGLFVNTIYLLPIWTIGVPIALGIAVDSIMVTLFLFIAMAAYQKELISRQLFVREGRERDALARQNQSNTRYLDWLRQLAAFLRHEVRQPVAQINSSVEIAQIVSKGDERPAPYLASAMLGAQHVWNLVERASQATDVEAFVRRARLQRTELNEMVAEQVAAFARSNSGVDFCLHHSHRVYVNADPMLVTQALVNLLTNAASFANENTTIDVGIKIDANTVVVSVANKGPPLAGEIETLFGPFVSTRASPSSEHQGLGLYMVRLIAEEHGGAAALANLDDNSGVTASIVLPLPGAESRVAPISDRTFEVHHLS
jgi:signal transduction histidine kinase